MSLSSVPASSPSSAPSSSGTQSSSAQLAQAALVVELTKTLETFKTQVTQAASQSSSAATLKSDQELTQMVDQALSLLSSSTPTATKQQTLTQLRQELKGDSSPAVQILKDALASLSNAPTTLQEAGQAIDKLQQLQKDFAEAVNPAGMSSHFLKDLQSLIFGKAINSMVAHIASAKSLLSEENKILSQLLQPALSRMVSKNAVQPFTWHNPSLSPTQFNKMVSQLKGLVQGWPSNPTPGFLQANPKGAGAWFAFEKSKVAAMKQLALSKNNASLQQMAASLSQALNKLSSAMKSLRKLYIHGNNVYSQKGGQKLDTIALHNLINKFNNPLQMFEGALKADSSSVSILSNVGQANIQQLLNDISSFYLIATAILSKLKSMYVTFSKNVKAT